MAMYSAVIIANFANNKPRLAKTNANNNDNTDDDDDDTGS